MINAAEIQAILLGGGGALGMGMAGVGFYRLCMSGANKIAAIPAALDLGAEELGKLRVAVESNNSLTVMVTEQGAILKTISENLNELRQEGGGGRRTEERRVG